MNILITGAVLPAAVGLVRAFGRAGHRVVLAGCVWFATGRASRFATKYIRLPSPRFEPDAFAESVSRVVAEHDIDLIIPCFEETFYLAKIADRIGIRERLFCDSIDRLETLHDKAAFIELATGLGLPTPTTHRIESRAELASRMEAGDWVLKPVHSRFSENVFLSPTASEVAGLDVSPESPWVLQQRLRGRPICTYSVAHRGSVTAHSSYSSLLNRGAGASVACESVVSDAAEAWVRELVARTEFHGQISFDFIEDDSGQPLAIECNPRATTGAFFLADDSRFADHFVATASSPLRAKAGDKIINRLVGTLMQLEARSDRDARERIRDVSRACRDYYFSSDDRRPWLWRFVSALGIIGEAKLRRTDIESLTTKQTVYQG